VATLGSVRLTRLSAANESERNWVSWPAAPARLANANKPGGGIACRLPHGQLLDAVGAVQSSLRCVPMNCVACFTAQVISFVFTTAGQSRTAQAVPATFSMQS